MSSVRKVLKSTQHTGIEVTVVKTEHSLKFVIMWVYDYCYNLSISHFLVGWLVGWLVGFFLVHPLS